MANKQKYFSSIISIILVMLIAFSLPVNVFAETITSNKNQHSVNFDSLAVSEEDSKIVGEIKTRRDEFTKHFRMDNGTVMAVTYDEPVHFKNSKGKWLDYDNSLIEAIEATPDEANKSGYYSNKKSNLNITLSADARADKMVNISSKYGEINWKYSGVENTEAKIRKNKQNLYGNSKFISLEKTSSQISYSNIYKNVDLNTVLTTTGVKENLILNNPNAQNEFILDYNIKGFSTKQTDSKTIEIINNKGKIVYSITAPYMYDANGEISDKLSLSILSRKKDSLLVKLTADRDFIKSNERKFPVTIDPEVTLKSSINIELADTSSAQPNTALNSCSWFSVGTIDNAEHRGLIKCKTLQNYSDKNIVSAKLKIVPDTSTPEMEIEAVPVTSSWTTQNATYNNTALGSEIIDYANTNTDSSDAIAFDLTKYFKKWLSGDIVNNGICLKSNDNGARFGGSENSDSKKVRFEIIYKDYVGIESNLTSHSMPCGQDATLSVCDYTGSLSVKQVFFEENTERLPLSLYATYHSLRNSTNEHTGYGWHLSFNETITEDNNYYIYMDADGINHYFKKETGEEELTDEDGSLTLKIDSTNNKLEIDNDSITKAFEIVDNTDVYKIKSESDNEHNNNSIQFSYNNGGDISTITTSLGNYSVSYENESIDYIYTPNNRSMHIEYYSGENRIARFTSVDNRCTKFNYSNIGGESLLYEAHFNGPNTGTEYANRIRCTYNSDKKVTKIQEYGKNNASRHYLDITYNDDNTTTFVDTTGHRETYTFDNYGNTVTVLNFNGSVTNNSDSGSLSISTGADSYTKNYIADSNEPDTVNSSFVSDGYFSAAKSIGSETSQKGTVTVESGTAYLGEKSIKVENTGASQFYTVAKRKIQNSDLEYKTITLSSYVKLNNITAGTREGSSGVVVGIEAYDNSNNLLTEVISPGLVEDIPSYEWQRVSATLINNSYNYNADYFIVFFGLRDAQGTAWFDCMQLETSAVMNDYNALENSDFASVSGWENHDGSSVTKTNDKVILTGTGGEPAQTYTDETEPSTVEEATDATVIETEQETFENDIVEETNTYGNAISSKQGFVTRTYRRTYGIEPTTDPAESTEPTTVENEEEESESAASNNYIYQEVPVNISDVAFNISGTAKAKSIPLNDNYRTFGIALKLKYEDDSDYSETHYQEFNAYTDIFQNITLSVTPDDSEKTVESVAFAFVYDYNKNEMEIKNAMLNFTRYEPGSAVEETTGTQPTTAEETTEPPTSEPEPTDDGRYLIDEEIVSESVDESQPFIQTEKNYDSNGNYVTAETDEYGNEYSYTVDSDGNTTSVTDGRNNLTSYTYDIHGNILSVSAGDSSNTYTYDDYSNLTTLAHNDFSYNYTYDSFHNPLTVSVGSNTLAAYTYDSLHDKLTRVTYGNGDYIKYTYDSYKRIINIESETETLATYAYNKKGLVTKLIDGKSGETTVYAYDCAGSALYSYTVSANGTKLVRKNTDGTNTTLINGNEYTVRNGYDDDTSYVQYGSAKVASTTDDFSRTTQVSAQIGTLPAYTVDYGYKDDDTDKSTDKLVRYLTTTYNNTTLTDYEYIYDASGNIIEIKDNNISIFEFTYDSLNQMTTCHNKRTKAYYEYDYDSGGNITATRIYSYTTSFENRTQVSSNSYQYSDSAWGDKLTKFDNYTITYDSAGNPLSYRDGMNLTWQNGRELKQITKGNNTYSFKYNINGLRTEKNVNGTKTYYYYDGNNNLIGLKKGNVTALFYYDSDNSVQSMKVGDNTYFFVKNLQGDIDKIIDSSGNVVATYLYYADGYVYDTTENSAISGLNPFRYRGYVYDTETDLYYLQSRYYDSFTCRFLNADAPEYTDTYSGSPLSTNMFAYCENNPVSGYDPSGNDAIWLQAPGSVSGFGHTSLLVEDSNKKWWYFYWGDKSIQLFCLGHRPKKINNVIKKIIKVFNKEYKKLKLSTQIDKYEKGILFKGNFTKSFCFSKRKMYSYSYTYSSRLYVAKWKKSHPYSLAIKGNKEYDFWTNNCMQITAMALYQGTLSKKSWREGFINILVRLSNNEKIPNVAYGLIRGYGTEIFFSV